VYDLREDIRHLPVTKEQIVTIIESINMPMVAASGRSLENTKAFIIGVRNRTGLYSIYIYLYLMDSNDCLIYLHEPPEVSLEAYQENELDALGFVENMGFMVDNLNFRTMPSPLQEETMERIPAFHEDLKGFANTGNETEASVEGDIDLSPLEDDVLELDEVAEVMEPRHRVSAEGLAKIIRMFSSF
jgi:hypothetical protein